MNSNANFSIARYGRCRILRELLLDRVCAIGVCKMLDSGLTLSYSGIPVIMGVSNCIVSFLTSSNVHRRLYIQEVPIRMPAAGLELYSAAVPCLRPDSADVHLVRRPLLHLPSMSISVSNRCPSLGVEASRYSSICLTRTSRNRATSLCMHSTGSGACSSCRARRRRTTSVGCSSARACWTRSHPRS